MAILTWLQPSPIQYGTPLSSTQLNATSDSPGEFIYSPSPGTILSVGTNQVLSATFYSESGSQTVSTTITVTKLSPVISWATPANINIGTPLSATQLNASTTVAGNFIYTPASGTVLGVGTHTINTVFVPNDTTNINSTTSSVQIVVQDVLVSLAMNPVVTSVVTDNFGNISGQLTTITGTYLSGATANLTSLVTATYSSASVLYTNGLIQISLPGNYTITFSYQGISQTYSLTGIAQTPSVPDVVNPVFYKSHIVQELLNYFDRNDIRVRENPCTIDGQLLALPAVALEILQLKLARETQVNLNSPCNIDNCGVYYAFTNSQASLSSITTVTGLVSGVQTVFTELDDTLPVPVGVVAQGNSYNLSNPVLTTVTGNSIIQNICLGVLPWPEKLTFLLTGVANTEPNVDIAITGYLYPSSLWVADQQLYTEVVDMNVIGVAQTINKWANVINICIRGLTTGYNLNVYGHTFTLTYQPDIIRPVVLSTLRDVNLPRFWYNNISNSRIEESVVKNTFGGFDYVQSYQHNLNLTDIAIEPNTFGLVAVNNSNLYYTDRREPMPNNTSAMAISVDPIISIKVIRDLSNDGPFYNVLILPVLYPTSASLFQYRIYFTDPVGANTVITADGEWLTYNNTNGWRAGVPPKSISLTLPLVGSYTFTIQARDTTGALTQDSYLYNNLQFNSLSTISLASYGEIQGVCYDSDDNLWVWNGTTAQQLSYIYNNYIADTTSNILYLTRDASGVTVT